jgi:hypothetical protein
MDSSQFPDDEDSEDLSALRERTRGATRVYCSYPPETRAAKVREYLRESLREAHVGGSANDAIQVWKPSVVQDAWFVPWNGPVVVSREQYCLQFESRLRALIAQNQREAKDILTGSLEWNPDFYEIALYNPTKHWAALIVHCGQMQISLNQIDWSKPGKSQNLTKDDLPSLADICASVPT